ncbi:MAG: DNA polymerase I, partial [Deltaproteobacteria bacterium]|nr:DNA polymerase I [Deltaproteobacteria bacterium]
MENEEYLAVDTETDNINPLNAGIVGISLCAQEGRAYYIPIGHRYLGAPRQHNPEHIRERLNPFLAGKRLAGQNIKYDLLVFLSNGYKGLSAYDDTMIAAYLLDPEADSHSLKTLSKRYLNYDMFTYSEVTSSKKGNKMNFSEVDVETATLYSCEDADITFRLIRLLEKELKSVSLFELYRNVEMPLLNILTEMEYTGVYVNRDKLGNLSEYLRLRIQEEEEIIYRLSGERFNINSPKALSS